MPNQKTHRPLGAGCGLAVALYRAREQAPRNALVEAMGGAAGGLIFSMIPDWIDPPIHPGHRSLGHGVAPNVGIIYWYINNLDAWQSTLRKWAHEHTEAARFAESEAAQVWHVLSELLCRLAVGFVAGAGAGYVSHLALDATTRRGLPIVA